MRDSGYRWIPVSGAQVGGYYAAPPGEAVDARQYPWEQLDYPDRDWVAAEAGSGARARRTQLQATNPFGEAGGWQLIPRSIPPMEESPVRFASVRRTEGIQTNGEFLRGTGDLVVPAPRAVLLLDQSHLTNAFAVLEATAGAGSVVGLVYAEALKNARGNKGNRNDIDGRRLPVFVTSSGWTEGRGVVSRPSGSEPTGTSRSISPRQKSLGVSLARRTSLLEIDIVLQIVLDVRNEREKPPRVPALPSLGARFDLVAALFGLSFGEVSGLTAVVYALVGAAGLYQALFWKRVQSRWMQPAMHRA